jgi:hypothetical protein
MRFKLDKNFGYYRLVHDVTFKVVRGAVVETKHYYVAWYDKVQHQTCRRSLRTDDLSVAMDKINSILRSGVKGDPTAVLDEDACSDIAGVLDDYEKSHLDLASAGQTRTAINHLKSHIGSIRIDAWTKVHFRKFEKDFLARGYKKSYLSRICAVLRAALNQAEDDEKIIRAPKIPEVCSSDDQDAAPLRGRLMTTKEIANLFEQVNEEHFLDYLIAELNTASRPITILECDTQGIDWSHAIFEMNPAGRPQTKKYRPTVRIPKTWEPWLRQAPPGRLISFNGKPVQSIKKAFRTARKNADLKPDAAGVGVATYSIRHTLARYLEDCGVPHEQISILLGHVKIDRKKTTDRYSPRNPRSPLYLSEATQAIERFVHEVNQHTKKWDLLIPYATKAEYKKDGDPQPCASAENFESKNSGGACDTPASDQVEVPQTLRTSTTDERS